MEDTRIKFEFCSECKELFPMEEGGSINCIEGNTYIDYRGKPISRHDPDENFKLNRFINQLHSTSRLSWREIYWKLWSKSVFLCCEQCKQRFPVCDLLFCKYHPSQIEYEEESGSIGR